MDAAQRNWIQGFTVHVKKLKDAWKSESKEFTSRPQTLEQYCLHAPGTDHASKRDCRILTEEPYFQVEGEERMLLSDRRFCNITNAQKCPVYKEKFGQHRPGRADEPRPAHTSSSDVNSTLLIKYLQKDVERLEDENNDLKQKNETLRIENDALQQQAQGAEERAIDVDLEELRDKVQQRLQKEGKRMSAALTNIIDDSDAELRSTLQRTLNLRVKYNQEVGSLEKKFRKANSINEFLELRDSIAQLRHQFDDEIFQFQQGRFKLLINEYLNVCGRGEKPLNHTMRALQLDDCPEDIREQRKKSYENWLRRVCDIHGIKAEGMADNMKVRYYEDNLKAKHPINIKLVNTFADFDARILSMREDFEKLNLLHKSTEKVLTQVGLEDHWSGFQLAWCCLKNESESESEPAPEPPVHHMTTRSPPGRGKRRKSVQPQSTDT